MQRVSARQAELDDETRAGVLDHAARLDARRRKPSSAGPLGTLASALQQLPLGVVLVLTYSDARVGRWRPAWLQRCGGGASTLTLAVFNSQTGDQVQLLPRWEPECWVEDLDGCFDVEVTLAPSSQHNGSLVPAGSGAVSPWHEGWAEPAGYAAGPVPAADGAHGLERAPPTWQTAAEPDEFDQAFLRSVAGEPRAVTPAYGAMHDGSAVRHDWLRLLACVPLQVGCCPARSGRASCHTLGLRAWHPGIFRLQPPPPGGPAVGRMRMGSHPCPQHHPCQVGGAAHQPQPAAARAAQATASRSTCSTSLAHHHPCVHTPRLPQKSNRPPRPDLPATMRGSAAHPRCRRTRHHETSGWQAWSRGRWRPRRQRRCT